MTICTGRTASSGVTVQAGLLLITTVVVLMVGFAVGFAARGDDNRRYHASRERYLASQLEPAPQVVHAIAERDPSPVVVNLYIPGLPQPVPAPVWPSVVEGQVIRELPPVGWGN